MIDDRSLETSIRVKNDCHPDVEDLFWDLVEKHISEVTSNINTPIWRDIRERMIGIDFS